jgi:predicted signal transduction protein with EAL and GGDEF domain
VCTITISIGGATFPRDGKTLNELLEIADAEMYRSKEAGRNKVSFRGMEPAGPGLTEEPPEPLPDDDNA